MKKMATVLAFLPALSAPVFAAEGDPCPTISGQFVSTFVGVINDSTGDSVISDGKFNLRVPLNINPPVKYSGGLKELAIGEQVKYQASVQDVNKYCIATYVEVRPASSTSTGGSKLRGGSSN